jgi:hypothetical protein
VTNIEAVVAEPDREPGRPKALSGAAPAPPPDPQAYKSIDAVPDEVVRDELLKALRTYGATPEDDLIRAVREQLGFKSTGSRLKARVGQSLQELLRSGRVCRAADQRLQLAQPCRTGGA